MFVIQEFINCRPRQTPPISQTRGILLDLIFAAYGPRSCSMSFHRQPETKNKFQGLPLGAKAIQIADGRVSNYFLTTFGRAKGKLYAPVKWSWNQVCRKPCTF